MSVAPASRPNGGLSLLAAAAAVTLLWLVAAPRLADWLGVASRVDQLRARGVEPGALYYTEQPLTFGPPGRSRAAGVSSSGDNGPDARP